MAVATLTLTDFLLSRIAEDEADAQCLVIPAWDGHKPHPELARWVYKPDGEVEYAQTEAMLDHKYPDALYVTCDSEGLSPSVTEHGGAHIARWDPARVLAECEAKRRIVAAHEADEWGLWCMTCAREPAPCPTLRTLASIYADHPDYRSEWRR